MAEKTIVVDIDIKAEDIRAASAAMAEAQKQSAAYTQALNDLKTQQKENSALYKVGAIDAKENAKRQAELKIQMSEVSKGLRESNKEYANNKTVVDAAKGSNEQLRARLSLLTKQYNALSKEERENTKAGQQMQATIKGITDKLKANEKAVGDNRRNVGNYEEALKGVAGQINVMGVNLGNVISQLETFTDGVKQTVTATKAQNASIGATVTGLGALKLALIATGLGAFLVVLGSVVSFLTKTKEGSEALARVMSQVGAAVSVVVDRLAKFGAALNQVRLGNFAEAAELAKESVSGIGEELANETKEAKELTRRLQELTDAERDLTVERSNSRATIKELNKIAEDTSKTLKEREEAAMRAIDIEKGLMAEQVRLAQERFDIIKAQNEQGNSLAEDLDRQAEAEKRLGEIRAESLEMQTTLQNKLNTIRQQDQAMRQKAVDEAKKRTQEEIKAEEERIKAIEQGYIEERRLIDEIAETKKNQAIVNIANAEQQAEAIRFIEREALLDKLRVIEEETAAYTASADSIGAVDEEKYAKQLALKAKYEAQIVMMDRAAKAEAFTNQVTLLNNQEQLDIQSAELSIDNAERLEAEKYKISLKYAQLRLELMREGALLDGVLSDEETQKLQEVENTIKRLQGLIAEEGGTLAGMLGISEEDLGKMQTAMGTVTQLIQGVQSLVSANAEARLQEIETENEYQIRAIENSTLSEEQKDAKIQALNRKAAQEKYEIEVQQFKTAKGLQIALAVANTATAVMAQLSNPTPYVGFVLAALAAATGAIQIGTIAAQKPPPPPKFADGGILRGNTHAQGGIQLYGRDGTHYGEAEDGEPVLTSGVSKNPYLLKAASDINVAAGGVPLVNSNYMAQGGIASPTFAARNATNSNTQGLESRIDQLGDRIERMQPVVRVTDINRVNRQSVKVQQSADL